MTGPRIPRFDGPQSIPKNLAAFTGTGVSVGVVDSGWATSLKDDQVLPGVGLVDPNNDFRVLQTSDDQDRLGHGTACADLVLRMAPGVTIVPIRVFGSRLETSPAVIVAALDWASARGIPLINLSLGTRRADALEPLYLACERARQRGTVIVAADRPGKIPTLPAVFENVIAVGGWGPGWIPSGGDRAGAVEVWASAKHHGVRCGSTDLRTVAGSSFAAPIVTGLLARLIAKRRPLSLQDIRRFLSEATVA